MHFERESASLCGWKEAGMATTPTQTDAQRAEDHANEAERLLKGRLALISSHVQAQVHATLAVYYLTRHNSHDE
jgi:hypothetical protein